MPQTVVLCPACGEPARMAVALPDISPVSRYTCHACGLTTLSDELVRDVRLRHTGWGSAPSTIPSGPALPVTLRPPGVTGDQSDATGIFVANFTGTELSAWTDNLGGSFSGTVTKIEIYARIECATGDVGPATPILGIQFREGSGGSIRGTSTFTASDFNGTFIDYGPFAFTTDQSGNPWTLASVSTLQFRISAVFDDLGSLNLSEAGVSEFWVIVS